MKVSLFLVFTSEVSSLITEVFQPGPRVLLHAKDTEVRHQLSVFEAVWHFASLQLRDNTLKKVDMSGWETWLFLQAGLSAVRAVLNFKRLKTLLSKCCRELTQSHLYF